MRVGFIGLGTQGKPLAIDIANAGHDLVVSFRIAARTITIDQSVLLAKNLSLFV